MNYAETFCTCTDRMCPNHPANHKNGCTPCIAKCRKERELPSCFFNMLDLKEKPESYQFEDFARLVLEQCEKMR